MRLLRLRKTIVEINTNEFFITKKAIESLTEKLGLPKPNLQTKKQLFPIHSSRFRIITALVSSKSISEPSLL